MFGTQKHALLSWSTTKAATLSVFVPRTYPSRVLSSLSLCLSVWPATWLAVVAFSASLLVLVSPSPLWVCSFVINAANTVRSSESSSEDDSSLDSAALKKKRELKQAAANWVAPTVTGVNNSEAIVQYDDLKTGKIYTEMEVSAVSRFFTR